MKIKIEYQSAKGVWNLVCVTSNYASIEDAQKRFIDDMGMPAHRVRATVVEGE